MNSPSYPPVMSNKHGFTLVEVMVAMVIGMLGLIIMMQVFSEAERQRRATTGTGDAQSNGAMALYALQRDIRQGGYGFNALNALGCTVTLPAPASRTLTQLAPVVINPPTTDVPAGDANSDTLLLIFGNGDGSPEGDLITVASGSQVALKTTANFPPPPSGGPLQWVAAAPAAATVGCALTLAQVTAVAAPNLTVAGTGAVDGGTLFNFGSNPRILAYAVRAGNLTFCDYLLFDCSSAANYVAIANNIVSLRAQYGRDTSSPMDGIIDTWDQTTPAQPSPANQEVFACLWARAAALRIAVVARNSQVERDAITAAAPTWTGSGGAPVDLSARANWQNYRYRVFETVLPLRNLPWMTSCTI